LCSVVDLCGLLPALESLDEGKIVSDLLGLEMEISVPLEVSVVRVVREFMDSGLRQLLKGEHKPPRYGYSITVQEPWSVYVLAASYSCEVLAGQTISRRIALGPVRFLDDFTKMEQHTMLSGEAGLIGGGMATWCLAPKPFAGACSWLGLILMVSVGSWFTPALSSPIQASVLLDSRVYFLVDRQHESPDAVAKAWTEACLLGEYGG
jgi:hypothetical protein